MTVTTADGPFDVVVLGGGIVGLWTAREAEAAGLSCCVIEIGGRDLRAATRVSPPLVFPEQENLGATRARHHVLTGNSAFWGGGLIRNPRDSLVRVLGCAADDPILADIERAYDRVEGILGVSRRERASNDLPPILASFDLQETVVLPGKRRGLWSNYLSPHPDGTALILTEARITDVAFNSARLLHRVSVRGRDGGPRWIEGRSFVLSMGVIDSCLFARHFLGAHMSGGCARWIGRGLHDHWSVPIAEICWRNRTLWSPLFPPKFARAAVIGRRLGFANGFFHVVADFDTLPPYDRIKRLLAARQRGAPLVAVLADAAAALARPVAMAKAAVHSLARRELLVPDGTRVQLVVDFESTADPANRVARDGEVASMHWAVRPADKGIFCGLLRTYWGHLADAARQSGLDLRWLVDPRDEAASSAYLSEKAIDAYHLGGGLAGTQSAADARLTSVTGQLLGIDNLFVMGTAAFHAPGVANPVLTLLARASALVETLRPGGP